MAHCSRRSSPPKLFTHNTAHSAFAITDTEDIFMAKKAKEGGSKIVPLGDRVVLKREEAGSTTAGGIVLPDSAKDKPQKGTVISVGDGYVSRDGKRHALSLKVGDKVIFSSYAGDEIAVGDDEYLLLRESDVLAVY